MPTAILGGVASSGVPEYVDLNRANWDERVPAHAASPDYGLDRFDDPSFISDVVRFDLPRLGDVAGLTGVHLQCHIGTDTVSLARLGARMTGLDFSAPALSEARELAARAGADVAFVQVGAVRRAGRARTRILRPRVHRHRGPVLVAQHRPVGRGRQRAPAPGWAFVHPRGAPGALGDGRSTARRPPAARPPLLRAAGRDPLRRRRHVRRHRRRVRAQHDDRVEPRPRRDRDRPPRPRPRPHDARRARQRARGTPCPATWPTSARGEFRLIDRPERLPHSYTLSAVKRA